MGFVLTPEEAHTLIKHDSRNADVIKPYLNGEDVNSRPGCSPSRWVIDFRDWPLERAQEYPECLEIVVRRVKLEREKLSDATYRGLWWRFGRPQMSMRAAIAPLDRVLVITLVSKVVQPVFVPTGTVFSHALGVFAYDDDAHFGLLSSGFHWWWAVTRASTMRTDVRYTPSDCFETFPQPDLTPAVAEAGRRLDERRRALMLDRQEGLTKTYNRVHDPDEGAADIAELRALHVALDHAVRDAYGWRDIELGHGFHETRQGVRYTFEPVARQEVLDRLLELNHDRYEEEKRMGLHDRRKGGRRAGRPAPAAQGSLLGEA